MEESHIEEVESQNKVIEVAPALVSVHPSQKSIAVTVERINQLLWWMNKDSIRAIRYGASGKLFVCGRYDKLVKIWLHDFLLFSETSSYMIIMMADLLRRELVRLL
ncbi:unnamed protein product [Brassica rapa]|uniref:Uncharacterized protein n=1 Tax=Brassica campestris TaxID=3711 RepID=A0A8D9MEN2_BRACM|nr:unnamed protein product [Brassica rapa]